MAAWRGRGRQRWCDTSETDGTEPRRRPARVAGHDQRLGVSVPGQLEQEPVLEEVFEQQVRVRRKQDDQT